MVLLMVHVTWATEMAKLPASSEGWWASPLSLQVGDQALGFPWSQARLLGKLRASPVRALRLCKGEVSGFKGLWKAILGH